MSAQLLDFIRRRGTPMVPQLSPLAGIWASATHRPHPVDGSVSWIRPNGLLSRHFSSNSVGSRVIHLCSAKHAFVPA